MRAFAMDAPTYVCMPAIRDDYYVVVPHNYVCEGPAGPHTLCGYKAPHGAL